MSLYMPGHDVLSFFFSRDVFSLCDWNVNTWPVWKPFLKAAYASVGSLYKVRVHDRRLSSSSPFRCLVMQGPEGIALAHHVDGDVRSILFSPGRTPWVHSQDKGYPLPRHVDLPYPVYILTRTSLNHFRRTDHDPWWYMPMKLTFSLPPCLCPDQDIRDLDADDVEEPTAQEAVWKSCKPLVQVLVEDVRVLEKTLRAADAEDDSSLGLSRLFDEHESPLYARSKAYVEQEWLSSSQWWDEKRSSEAYSRSGCPSPEARVKMDWAEKSFPVRLHKDTTVSQGRSSTDGRAGSDSGSDSRPGSSDSRPGSSDSRPGSSDSRSDDGSDRSGSILWSSNSSLESVCSLQAAAEHVETVEPDQRGTKRKMPMDARKLKYLRTG